MSDNQQILRLLATLREEVAAVRSRQEELYELLISYKDQVHDLKTTVVTGLEGLPTSPYIAGQLIPAPQAIDGVDDLREVLATYLHKYTNDSAPTDVVFDPPAAVDPAKVQLEPDDDPLPRRRGRGPRRDMDLERGPDRDVEVLDLDGPDKKKKSPKKRRRSRGRRKKGGEGDGGDDAPQDAGEAKPAGEAKEAKSKASKKGGKKAKAKKAKASKAPASKSKAGAGKAPASKAEKADPPAAD